MAAAPATSCACSVGLGAPGSLHRLLTSRAACWPRSASAGRRELGAGARRWRRRRGPKRRSPTGSFDIVTISAVLHHVPVEERQAVYAELGRVLKPGGRIYVFEHNPRNPLVRYVIARTPIDANAILLDAREVRLRAARHGALRPRDRLPDVHAARPRLPAPHRPHCWRGCRWERNMSWRRARPPKGETGWTDRPSRPS